MVFVAVAVTTLRVALPQLNHFQPQITSWVNQGLGLNVETAQIYGSWRNTRPSLSLSGVKVQTPEESGIHFSVESLDIELDLMQSILQQQPVVANLAMHDLLLDVQAIEWVKSAEETPELTPKGEQKRVVRQLDQLLLRQLARFSVTDSKVLFTGIDGSPRELAISNLSWQNVGNRHIADGEVSLAHSNINSAIVRANFQDNGSFQDISGEFYLSAQNILITPWLTKHIQSETGIEKGQVSFSSWLTLTNSQPTNAYVEVEGSELVWNEGAVMSYLLILVLFNLNLKRMVGK